jgi:hypothetical protein
LRIIRPIIIRSIIILFAGCGGGEEKGGAPRSEVAYSISGAFCIGPLIL